MKISHITSLNLKKLKTKPKKAMFLIVPVAILITLSIVISSQVQNIQEALSNSVFDTISTQYTLLSLKVEEEEFDPASMFNQESSFEQNKFSTTDVTNIESIEGFENASLQAIVPIQNINSSDLFSDKTISINNLSTLNESTSALFTSEDFTYTEGEAIPIVLSANSFTYTYEDWSQGDSYTIDMSPPSAEGGTSQTPIPGGMNRITIEKTEAIKYSKDDLIGNTFTVTFGGLDEIRDYTTTMNRDTRQLTVTKLTDEEYASKIEERKTSISQYWDYDKVSTPLTYTFVIAGIDETESETNNYVPEEFATVLMNDYISNEINARTVEEIPSDVLNADFMGLTYDGDELSSGNGGIISQIGGRFQREAGSPPPMGGGEFQVQDVNFSAITIPGLVIELDDEDAVIGTLDNPEIYNTATKYADSISIVLTDITYRSEVITSLNQAGYAFQDLGDLDVFENLESTLKTVSNAFLVSFVILVASIVILTMGKLVSESTREIGIFRAIGMRKGDVLKMFVSQSLLYISIGYFIGLLFGIGLNFVTAGIVSTWFDSFINETISQSFNVISTVDSSAFMSINWTSVLVYSVLLFIITLVVSIIPAMSASRISPVEAIKSE